MDMVSPDRSSEEAYKEAETLKVGECEFNSVEDKDSQGKRSLEQEDEEIVERMPIDSHLEASPKHPVIESDSVSPTSTSQKAAEPHLLVDSDMQKDSGRGVSDGIAEGEKEGEKIPSQDYNIQSRTDEVDEKLDICEEPDVNNCHEKIDDSARDHECTNSTSFSVTDNKSLKSTSEVANFHQVELNNEVMDDENLGHYTESKEDNDTLEKAPSHNEGVGMDRSPKPQNGIPSPERKSVQSRSPSTRKHSRSPEKNSAGRKRASSHERSSPPVRRKSSSEKASYRDSRHRDDSPRRTSVSPRKRDSPRRRDRSTSRSPPRKRDSSGHRRDHRGRSRSRSPSARDHYRRSPRY